jgi:hypothetical protein
MALIAAALFVLGGLAEGQTVDFELRTFSRQSSKFHGVFLRQHFGNHFE